MFTCLTGIWELAYILNKDMVSDMAHELVFNNEHAWGKTYNLRMILPHNLSKVFYAEYAAYADRIYACTTESWRYWSIIIEGTHCLCCGLWAMIAIYSCMVNGGAVTNVTSQAIIMSMSYQEMNSILYISMYCVQLFDSTNVNYIDPINFPLSDRKFMLINICWTVMPFIILMNALIT